MVIDLHDYLQSFVDKFGRLLAKNYTDDSLPAIRTALDIGMVCDSYGMRRISPTKLRKAASTTAFDQLDDTERRKLATQMTQIQNAVQSILGQKPPIGATKALERMSQILYGGCGDSSSVSSSAGVIQRQALSSQATSIFKSEVRRLCHHGQFVTHTQSGLDAHVESCAYLRSVLP